MAAGSLGCFFFGFILSQKYNFKSMTSWLAFLNFSFYAAFVALLNDEQKYLSITLVGCMGFFNAAVIPIALEFAAEATYPVSEAYSSGILFFCSNLLTIPLSVLSEFLMDDYPLYSV